MAKQLSERDQHILDFEREAFTLSGPKQRAIRERFEMSPTTYYRLVNRLLEEPAALDYDPLTVKRLRRHRSRRRRMRFEGRRAGPGPR